MRRVRRVRRRGCGCGGAARFGRHRHALLALARALHGLRVWISHALHIAIPLYWGRLGLYIVPSPVGFPRRVPQQIVFGDPIRFETQASPTKEYVAACHAQFVDALERLFDAHKAEFGYADRSLEVL